MYKREHKEFRRKQAMNKKIITHILMIAAIVTAVFAAAALTPSDTYAKTEKSSGVINIAKVDYENRTVRIQSKAIADNEMPLAAVPSQSGSQSGLEWVILGAVALITIVIIRENRRIVISHEDRTQRLPR